MYLDATDLDAPCQDCDSSAALQWGTQNAVGRSMTEQLPGGMQGFNPESVSTMPQKSTYPLFQRHL